MGKLFKLKEWLTVADAARYLAISFGEVVTEADVLRLAIDGKLRLSVNFVNYTPARHGAFVSYEDVEWEEMPAEWDFETSDLPDAEEGNPIGQMMSENIDDKRHIKLERKVDYLQGVWDLPMIAGEKLEVEHQYQLLTGGPAVTHKSVEGILVERDNRQICQLQDDFDDSDYTDGTRVQLEMLEKHIAENMIGMEEQKSLLALHQEKRKKSQEEWKTLLRVEGFVPAHSLPKDSVLVVRTQSLTIFEQSLSANVPLSEKPVSPREHTTYLNIIGALLELIQTPRPGRDVQTGVISEMLENYGDKYGISRSGLELKFAAANRSIRAP